MPSIGEEPQRRCVVRDTCGMATVCAALDRRPQTTRALKEAHIDGPGEVVVLVGGAP